MREEAGERRRTVQASAVGRRFLREAQRNCGHRHKDYREEQTGGADGGRCTQRQRKSHRAEEEVAEKIRNWARIVRPDGWTGEIQRTLIAMAIRDSKCQAGYALVWQRRMEEQKQGLRSDEMVWVAPRRKQRQRRWHPERAHWSITAEWLPFHLILGRLPVRQLCQLRCVCKPWDLMLESGEVQIDTNAKREEYWFVMFKPPPPRQENCDFMAFSSHSDVQGRKDWAFFRPPLPSQSHSKLLSLLGGLHCSLLSKLKEGYLMQYCTPRLVSTGGLMCTFVRKPGAADVYRIIVFNCFTGSVKVLPPPVDPRHLFGQMSARHSWTKFCCMYMAIDDVDPARYYIMLTHKQYYLAPAYFEIFDSRIGSWKVGRNPEMATANYEVADGDFFHCVDSSAGTSTLFAYHAADDVWSKVEVPKRGTDEFGCCFTLLKYKGRLLQSVILKVNSHNERICLGFAVMELQKTSSQHAVWLEVARTPQHLWHWLPDEEWDAGTQAEGSLFYMTIIGVAHLQGRFKPPLVYDIAQNNWYVLPSERGTTDFDCILVHRPRLSMRMPPLADSEEESDEALVPLPTVGDGNETRASFTQDLRYL